MLLADGAELISWETLSGVSGAVVLAFVTVAFLTDRIRATSTVKAEIEGWKQLYREAIEDRDRWAAKLDETTELLRKSVEATESLQQRVQHSTQQVNKLIEKGA